MAVSWNNVIDSLLRLNKEWNPSAGPFPVQVHVAVTVSDALVLEKGLAGSDVDMVALMKQLNDSGTMIETEDEPDDVRWFDGQTGQFEELEVKEAASGDDSASQE